jgi:hypothetical protein
MMSRRGIFDYPKKFGEFHPSILTGGLQGQLPNCEAWEEQLLVEQLQGRMHS